MNDESLNVQPSLTPAEIEEKARKKAEKKEKKKIEKEIKDDRTFIAFQRTLLSWVRTSTSLFTFGFAIWKLLEQQAHEPGDHPILKIIQPKSIGLVMIFSGFLGLFMAVLAYVKISKKFGRDSKSTYLDPAMLQSYVILTLCLLTLVGVLIGTFLA